MPNASLLSISEFISPSSSISEIRRILSELRAANSFHKQDRHLIPATETEREMLLLHEQKGQNTLDQLATEAAPRLCGLSNAW